MEIKLPEQSTIRAVAYAALAIAGIYYVKKFADFQKGGADLLKPVADGISAAYDKVRFAGQGVAGSFGFITLKTRDFENGYLKNSTRAALESMHPQNAGLLAQVVNPAGQLFPQYAAMLRINGLAVDENGVYAL